jgi:predicted RNA-binding protein with PIN domain
VSDPAAAVALPDSLLAPLLDEAAAVLRTLDDGAVPPGLRALRGFHARGLHAGAARQQLRRTVETDERFRACVVESFLARPEVAAVLEGWSAAAAPERLAEDAARHDLPLVASALYAARPPGYLFGLGVACGLASAVREEAARAAEAEAAEEGRRRAEQAARDAEEQRAQARAQAAELERRLREERAGRAAREQAARREAEAARREADAARREADEARRLAEAAGQRAARAEERAERLRRQVTELERALEKARRAERDAAAARPPSAGDVRTLAEAADLARRLAEALGGLADAAGGGGGPRPAPATPAAAAAPGPAGGPARRVGSRPTFRLPPGVVLESPEGLDAALRTPGAALVVDGYNVAMRAWPRAAAADQRERLTTALAACSGRIRAAVTVVFDGADEDLGARPRSSPGVRVVFSAPGQEADEVVVAEARRLTPTAPVLVASSDRWVQDHAEACGARVLDADAFLRWLRA